MVCTAKESPKRNRASTTVRAEPSSMTRTESSSVPGRSPENRLPSSRDIRAKAPSTRRKSCTFMPQGSSSSVITSRRQAPGLSKSTPLTAYRSSNPVVVLISTCMTPLSNERLPSLAWSWGFGRAGVISNLQSKRFICPGFNSAAKTTRFRQSMVRLLSSFSICVGNSTPSLQTLAMVNSSFQFWSASMNSHSNTPRTGQGWGL